MILDEASAIVAPKLSLSILSFTAAAAETLALAGYRRLAPDDFTPLRPRLRDQAVSWVRCADVRLLQRRPPDGRAYSYAAMLFGPSGETIPTRISPA